MTSCSLLLVLFLVGGTCLWLKQELLEKLTRAAASGQVFVATNGSDTPSCGTFTSPCFTISFAVPKTPLGGTIFLMAGVYHQWGIILNNREINIAAWSFLVTINCGTINNASVSNATESTVGLSGLTISGCVGAGGAVYTTHPVLQSYSQLNITSNVLLRNTATGLSSPETGGNTAAGAVAIQNVQQLWIANCAFADNMAIGGNGTRWTYGPSAMSEGSASAGAIWMNSFETAQIINSNFTRNVAVAGEGYNLEWVEYGCSGTVYGGAVMLNASALAVFQNCQFTENVAFSGSMTSPAAPDSDIEVVSGIAGGGAIASSYATLLLRACCERGEWLHAV